MHHRKDLQQMPEPFHNIFPTHRHQNPSFLPGKIRLFIPGKLSHLMNVKRIQKGTGMITPVFLHNLPVDRLGTADQPFGKPGKQFDLPRISHIHIAADAKPPPCPARRRDIGQIGSRSEAVCNINCLFLL